VGRLRLWFGKVLKSSKSSCDHPARPGTQRTTHRLEPKGLRGNKVLHRRKTPALALAGRGRRRQKPSSSIEKSRDLRLGELCAAERGLRKRAKQAGAKVKMVNRIGTREAIWPLKRADVVLLGAAGRVKKDHEGQKKKPRGDKQQYTVNHHLRWDRKKPIYTTQKHEKGGGPAIVDPHRSRTGEDQRARPTTERDKGSWLAQKKGLREKEDTTTEVRAIQKPMSPKKITTRFQRRGRPFDPP